MSMAEADADVLVVGGGHAGCEAALAAARMGCRTILLSMNLDLLAQMPCNPSIGGPAKGHLVREIDALGGEMARNADRTFIQIRLLNSSKGPAVRALRAQADKRLYSLAMKHVLEATPGLRLVQGLAEAVLTEQGRACGVALRDGRRLTARAVILAGGTFLNGRVLCGEHQEAAGRAGEFPALGLARSLREMGFELGRLQTNTPPRVDARTVRFADTEPQYGSETPLYFSHAGPEIAPLMLPVNPVYPAPASPAWRRQLPCYLAYTNDRTHRIIRDNLHRSPIASGVMEASGPRYCPSIEEKVVRYAHKEAHQLFLEPEGWATGEVYVQGLFTAMPVDVQEAMLRSVPALAEAEIVRPGYAIAYDHVPSHQLKPSLETRLVPGLFHAGQINGTSGYEEAAAQGLLAGANAALAVRGEEPLILSRHQAYLGVLVDDLITKEIDEPYRMMTSRAEYRLLLRHDNADLRLTALAAKAGLVSPERGEAVEARRRAVAEELARLEGVLLRPDDRLVAIWAELGLEPLQAPTLARQWLRRPGACYEAVRRYAPPARGLMPEDALQVEIEARYEGYIARQQRQVERARRLEERRLPEDLDLTRVIGLRNEARERLERHRPATVGQAARIQGVNPADISVLLVHLQRRRGDD